MRLITLALLALSACAPRSAVSRIEILEAQVNELEQEVSRLSEQRAPSRGERPPTHAELQQALQVFSREMSALSADARMLEIKQRCEAFQKEHADELATTGGQRLWRGSGRACREAEVVGTDAPDLVAETWFQGGPPPKKSPQLLVFWEQWCPHCKREVPKLEGLHQRFAGQMSVVALTKVNRTSTPEKVQQFIVDQGLTFAVAKEDGSLSEAFNVTGVPAAAIVNDGVIVWRGHPARLNDQILAELLAR